MVQGKVRKGRKEIEEREQKQKKGKGNNIRKGKKGTEIE